MVVRRASFVCVSHSLVVAYSMLYAPAAQHIYRRRERVGLCGHVPPPYTVGFAILVYARSWRDRKSRATRASRSFAPYLRALVSLNRVESLRRRRFSYTWPIWCDRFGGTRRLFSNKILRHKVATNTQTHIHKLRAALLLDGSIRVYLPIDSAYRKWLAKMITFFSLPFDCEGTAGYKMLWFAD